LCGGVQVSVSGFNEKAANCYCSMCRKFHGAAFGTLVVVKDLKWLTGEQLLEEFTASNGTVRTFCKNCGSSLGFRVQHALPCEIELAVAIFDEDIPITIDAQIYTAYKSNWCELNPTLKTFSEGRKN